MKFVSKQGRLVIAALCATLATGMAQAQGVLFWSTQASPVNEQQAMRDKVLNNAPQAVEFISNQEGPYFTRLNAEIQAGKGQIAVLGALHGQLASNAKDLHDVSQLAKDLKISPNFMKLGNFTDADQAPYPFIECVQTIFSVDGHNAPLTPGKSITYEMPDMYGRPWAAIWERYFEQGMKKPSNEEDLFKIGD